MNGVLFTANDIELLQLDSELLRIILEYMSEGFDWSGISPTIFGAVFESTLNQRIGTLKFFDPACNSGNFLTESYLSLRWLENKILSLS